MGFLLGVGGKTRTTTPAAVSGLQLQSSSYGVPIQLVYGTTKIAPNLIWYGDFLSIPVNSSGGSAGKGGVGGGGGGKGGGGATSYNYQTAVMLGLCEGPIAGIGNAYVDKNVTTPAALGMSTFLGSYPQAPWGYLTSRNGASVAEAHTVPATGPYTVTVSDAAHFYADVGVVGPPTVSTFTRVTGTPGVGQYAMSFNGTSQATYTFNAADAGNTVVIQYAGTYGASQSLQATIPASTPYRIGIAAPYGYFQDHGVTATNVAYTKVGASPGAAQYAVSAGVYTFASANAGATVTISYAAVDDTGSFQALPYNGVAFLAAAAYQLGNSAQLPNHNFEVMGPYSNSISGQLDADPAAVIYDFLTNSHHGAGFPADRLINFGTYQAYCIANGLWISPAYNQQTQASSILADIVACTNSEFVWSSGGLTIVPYGDQSITANGYTYTAPSAPQYDLTDDDFIVTGSEDPVRPVRKRPADAFNSIRLECLDRSNAYNPAVVEAKDQAMIDAFGLRQDGTRQAHLFADIAAARLSVQLLLQRQAVRNTYQFTLDQRYIVLDPMDLVTITDSALGLDKQWVRITAIEENDDTTLTFTAEEYLDGIASAPLHSFQTGAGYGADYNADPGDANAPILFDAPVQIAATGLEVWLAASGGPMWGGCDVWLSSDGDTYRNIGRITGGARMGTLSAALAAGDDPDTTHTLSVDLTQSRGQLLSGTQEDADALHTLCYADGELVAYRTASLTAQSKYDLSYLRRGAYGTTIASHPSGSAFARLDDGIFTFGYEKSKIGTTVYVKLASFNIYGGGQQQLSDVPAYAHTISGPPLPADVQGFQVQQVGNTVAFRWIELANDSGLKGYDIAYAPQGEDDWSRFNLLTEGHRGTEMTNASVPPGTWTFAIRARDIAGQLSPDLATADLVVTNANEVILSAEQAPLWEGTLVDAVAHYTGVIVPQSQTAYPQSTYSSVSPPGSPSLSSVTGGSLISGTYHVAITWLTGGNGTSPTAETTIGSNATIALAADGVSLVVIPPASVPANVLAYNVYADRVGFNLKKQNAAPIPAGNPFTFGTLAAGSAPPSINSTGWEVFDIFVPWPAFTSYTTPDYDTGFEANVRAWLSYGQALGPGQTGDPTPPQVSLSVDGVDQGRWTLGFVTGRYFQGELTYIPADAIDPKNTTYFTEFKLTIDNSPQVETVGGVVVSPGGTAVTFPQRFHLAPYVQATVVGSGALYATAASITATGCTFHVWDHTGTDVGGTISYTATGE